MQFQSGDYFPGLLSQSLCYLVTHAFLAFGCTCYFIYNQSFRAINFLIALIAAIKKLVVR